MIEIKNLHKSFGRKVIYKGLDLTVSKGELISIIGRSGCGKSVLLKLIMGICQPDSGQILLDGLCINTASAADLQAVRKKCAMVFQGAALFDSLSVAENVYFALDQHTQMPLGEKRKIAQEKLALVGLESALDLMPTELSGGMRKRVAIARAIAMDPELILYDEPTTGLDPITVDVINQLIHQLHVTMGITSIVVTHDMGTVYKTSDRVAMMYDGTFIFKGAVDELQNSSNAYVKQFILGHSDGPIGVDFV